MRRIRLALWVLVALAAAALGAALLRSERDPPPPPMAMAPAIGGPFTLTASDGTAFSSARLAGAPYAVFFGFTHCPDVCPTTLARLTRLRSQIPDGERRLPILFVSIDPERDTPAEVGRYSKLFGSPIVGLTGRPAAVDRVKKQFAAYSAKAPADDGSYAVDHTASVFLMDGQGRFVATISPGESDRVALDKLKRLVS